MLNTLHTLVLKIAIDCHTQKCSDGLRAWAFTAELVYNANHFLLVLDSMLIWEVIFWVVYNNSGSVMPQGSDEKGVSVCGIYSLQLMRMPMVELCT